MLNVIVFHLVYVCVIGLRICVVLTSFDVIIFWLIKCDDGYVSVGFLVVPFTLNLKMGRIFGIV